MSKKEKYPLNELLNILNGVDDLTDKVESEDNKENEERVLSKDLDSMKKDLVDIMIFNLSKLKNNSLGENERKSALIEYDECISLLERVLKITDNYFN